MAGRPSKKFSEKEQEVIRKLSEIHCTQQEIAHVMNCSVDVIKKPENLELIAQGKSLGKLKLRRAQFRKACEDGNPTLLIWLGKQMLGQTDQPINTDDNGILPWESE